MKLDVLLCDLQASYRLIRQCQSIIGNDNVANDASKFSLITMSDSELVIEMEDVSYYQQLQEVCENATIYQSASAQNAIFPRTQILDRMALFNGVAPKLFLMTEAEQLNAGNELYQLLRSRLKTWSKIDQVVNGDIKLEDLLGDEKISVSEINLITSHANIVSIGEQS
jgi:hypothetical protein